MANELVWKLLKSQIRHNIDKWWQYWATNISEMEKWHHNNIVVIFTMSLRTATKILPIPHLYLKCTQGPRYCGFCVCKWDRSSLCKVNLVFSLYLLYVKLNNCAWVSSNESDMVTTYLHDGWWYVWIHHRVFYFVNHS